MNFTVYKSSAGSGKTFTLVKEYLSIVLKNPLDFKHVLAITFTNKAAAEMKNRVLSNMQLLADFDNLDSKGKAKISDMYEALLNNGLKHNEIVQNSKKTLSYIIHNYNYFSLGTIDSFTHKIVKTFAFDLKLPLNFEVELEEQILIKQAIEILISNIGNDKVLTEFMLKYANSFVENETKVDIKYRLNELAKLLFREENIKYIKALQNLTLIDFAKIIEDFNSKKKYIENTVSTIAQSCLDLINSKNINPDSFFQKKNGLVTYLIKISRKNIIKPNSYVLNTINDNKWYSSSITESEMTSIDSIKDVLQLKVKSIIDIIKDNFSNYTIIINTLKKIYALSLLNEIQKILIQISNYDNIVHISEFSKSINEILNKEPIPFIYERVGERYKHFLIDEFQDTSILQWQNLIPLIDNSLSENNFNMIVGDGKQAIYRFRGGEVEQFSSLPEIYRKEEFNFTIEREHTLIRNYREKNLKTNYRSKSNIVEFNNSFFDFLVNKNPELFPDKFELIRKVYSEHNQDYKPSNIGGGVMIKFIPNENKKQYTEDTHKYVLSCIEKQISEGYQYSDITILCRSNSEAFHIANYLNDNSIKVISSESLLLTASTKVRLIIAIIKYYNNSSDAVNNANIIQLFSQIFSKTHNNFGNYILEISKKNNISDLGEFFSIFGFKPIKFLGLSLYELCEKIIENLNFTNEVDSYLIFFMDVVYNYSLKRNNSPEDFINWWNEKKDSLSLKSSSGLNAVNIMTIHKSKGLEFPVVIYPFADTSKNGFTKKYMWIKVKKEISENLQYSLVELNSDIKETEFNEYYEEEKNKTKLDILNVVYVALTRASERMFIFTSLTHPKPQQKNDENSNKTISFNLSQLFKSYADKSNLEKTDENTYIYGDFSPKAVTQKSGKELSIEFENNGTKNNINKKLNISKIAPEVWDAKNPDQLRNLGTIIHDILAKANNIEEIKNFLDFYIKNNKISISEKEKYLSILLKLSNNNTFKELLKNSTLDLKEQEIITPDANVIRPDRIVVNKYNTIIIDYKTGNKNENHIKQLELYKNIISKMGFNNIKLFLVYLKEEPEIEIW